MHRAAPLSNTVQRFTLLAVIPSVILSLLPAGCSTSDRQEEWSRPYAGYLPGLDVERMAVVLVRDRRTGAPLAGATMRAHPEMLMGPDGWAPLRAETRTELALPSIWSRFFNTASLPATSSEQQALISAAIDSAE